MTASAVGNATPSSLALMALREVEAGADTELADDVAPSAAFRSEQPATRQDSAEPAKTSSMCISGSSNAHTGKRSAGRSIRSAFAPSQTVLALCVREVEFELDG